jgi:hypothetical protein
MGLAGALGFEPRNGGTKNRCLTTWRRPNGAGGTRFGSPVQPMENARFLA